MPHFRLWYFSPVRVIKTVVPTSAAGGAACSAWAAASAWACA
ncbi:hypothetical protein [Enterococcus asini]|nr:hypothetical protein [Enterococcus asini]